jgi:hypothetical protein
MARLPTKIITLALVGIVLTGCSTTVPIKRTFPEVPGALLKECGPLNTINKPEVKLSELIETVSKNYGKYHECAAVVDAWQEWYSEQKKVFDELK